MGSAMRHIYFGPWRCGWDTQVLVTLPARSHACAGLDAHLARPSHTYIALRMHQVFLSSRLCYGLVNLKPLLPGHVLILPKRIVPRLEHLTPGMMLTSPREPQIDSRSTPAARGARERACAEKRYTHDVRPMSPQFANPDESEEMWRLATLVVGPRLQKHYGAKALTFSVQVCEQCACKTPLLHEGSSYSPQSVSPGPDHAG